ncbi:hypothetical protein ElyMa_000622100, partial [Elysia marginata]
MANQPSQGRTPDFSVKDPRVEGSLNNLLSSLGSGDISCWQDTDTVIDNVKENLTYLRHDVDTSTFDAYGVVDSYT